MSRRTKRISKLLQEIIAEIIVSDVSDPRLDFITITDVVISQDLKHANVFYSVFGDSDEAMSDAEEAFSHAGGYIQRRLSDFVQLQFTPKIHFKYDDTLAKAQAMEELIDKSKVSDDNDD